MHKGEQNFVPRNKKRYNKEIATTNTYTQNYILEVYELLAKFFKQYRNALLNIEK